MSSSSEASQTKVVIIRTGFSTHAMNMGQRMIELRSATSGSTVNVAALPPNPALFAPGPALAFVVVNGVPSQGKFVMVGNGKIGAQTVGEETNLNNQKREIPATSKMERRVKIDIFGALANATAAHDGQAASLLGADKQRADDIAQKLSGSPIVGDLLPAVEEVIGGIINATTQGKVNEVADAFSSGQLKDHLSG